MPLRSTCSERPTSRWTASRSASTHERPWRLLAYLAVSPGTRRAGTRWSTCSGRCRPRPRARRAPAHALDAPLGARGALGRGQPRRGGARGRARCGRPAPVSPPGARCGRRRSGDERCRRPSSCTAATSWPASGCGTASASTTGSATRRPSCGPSSAGARPAGGRAGGRRGPADAVPMPAAGSPSTRSTSRPTGRSSASTRRAADRAEALTQYRECVRVLDRELGVRPLPETTELYNAVNEGRSCAARRPQPPRPPQPSGGRPAAGRT